MLALKDIYIYHITYINNLVPIINKGGLLSDREAKKLNIVKESFTNAEIKENRLNKSIVIKKESYGCVGDYVPFHFRYKSPLLYQARVHQKQIIYLRANIEKVIQCSNHQWVFTDGNARANYTEFFTDPKKLLDFINENKTKIFAKDFAKRGDNIENNRISQAEFLYYDFFPLCLIDELGVYDKNAEAQAKKILQESQITVRLRKGWYF